MKSEGYSEKYTQASRENYDKYAGKPEVNVIAGWEEYTRSRWPNVQIEKLDTHEYKDFLERLGLIPEQAILRILRADSDFIDIESEYVKGITAHQIFPITSIKQEVHELDDIVFVAKQDPKAFNVRSIMPADVTLEIDPSLQFQAWGSQSSIRIPPLGRGKPPEGIIARGMWNVYKKVEPLVIFHEVAHSRQQFNSLNTQESVEAERDAWKFGLQCVRKLREKGIDLLPGVGNRQMISRLELGLLRYDSEHPGDLPKRFSRRFKGGVFPGTIHNFRHILKFISAVLKTANDDLSLVTETLLYKK